MRLTLVALLAIQLIMMHYSDFLSAEPSQVSNPYDSSPIKIATYCTGNPATARWLTDREQLNGTSKKGNYCYLPLSFDPNEGLQVTLNLAKLTHEGCSGDPEPSPSALEKNAVWSPQSLHVRISSDNTKTAGSGQQRTINIAVREVNINYDNDHVTKAGYLPWKKLKMLRVGNGQEIIRLPFSSYLKRGFK